MNNLDYLTRLNVPVNAQPACLKAMAKYADNHWWETTDLRTLGYWQLKEDFLLCDFSRFHEGVETLLNRPVFTHEFGINRTGLLQEAERAWTYGVGVTSEVERLERVAASIDGLRAWAKAKGKQVIEINLPDSEVE